MLETNVYENHRRQNEKHRGNDALIDVNPTTTSGV